MKSTRTHHLPPSLHAAVSHGTPETEPQTLGFGFLAQTLPHRLTLVNAQTPLPPHSPYPHCRITPRHIFRGARKAKPSHSVGLCFFYFIYFLVNNYCLSPLDQYFDVLPLY
jgi:hypothetical protein